MCLPRLLCLLLREGPQIGSRQRVCKRIRDGTDAVAVDEAATKLDVAVDACGVYLRVSFDFSSPLLDLIKEHGHISFGGFAGNVCLH